MRHRAAVVVGALALIVGGCSPGEVHEEQATPSQTREETFIERVRETVPEAREVNGADLTEYGEAVCDALDAGVTVEELGMAIGSDVQDVEVAGILGRLGGLATVHLCPEVLENGD